MTVLELVSTIIQAFSVLVAAIAIIIGVNAWRREFVGKKRIELVENVLALFCQAEDAIKFIRNPVGRLGEGKSRKRSEHEIEQVSNMLDRAYVVIERYQQHEQLFAELKSMKYRFMANFGSEAGKPFEELDSILKKIFLASQMLGTYYWTHQEQAFHENSEQLKKHLDQMRQYESILWYMGEDKDQIGKRVQEVIDKVEKIAHQYNKIPELEI